MRRNGLTAIELLLVMGIVATLIGLMTPAFLKIRELQTRAQTLEQLKRLTLATHDCNDAHNVLPPASGPFGKLENVEATLHVHLLPFLEQDELYQAIVRGDAGDLDAVIVPAFLSPQDFTQILAGAGISDYGANLRVFSDLGLETLHNKTITPDDAGNHPKTAKPWYYGAAKIPRSIPDGTSNTIAFCTQYSVCGSAGGIRHFTNPAGQTMNSAFFGYHAPLIEASADTGIADGRKGEIFQVVPAQADCNPSYTGQGMSPAGICLSLFDGSARVVAPAILSDTWGRAVQPNDAFLEWSLDRW